MAGLLVIGQWRLVMPPVPVVLLEETAKVICELDSGDGRLRFVAVVFLFTGLVRHAVLE